MLIPYRGPRTNHANAHDAACISPRGPEVAIVALVDALTEYAEIHNERYEALIGDDGVLGDHWQSIAEGALGLLNGECGRLDCGSVDAYIRQLCRDNAVTLPE